MYDYLIELSKERDNKTENITNERIHKNKRGEERDLLKMKGYFNY